MAYQLTHRKFLLANLNSTTDSNPTVQTCLHFCDSQRNATLSPYHGFCPPVCLAICPSLCLYSLTSPPLPELPPDFPPSIPNKAHDLSPLLISMLILLATTFLLITFYVLYTKLYFHYYAPNSSSSLQTTSRRRRGGRVGSDSLDEEHEGRVVFNPFWYIPTVGLPSTVIRSIAVHKYGKEMEESDCAVCLAEFEEGDELRVLPKCSHAFHIPCIDTWLSSHTTCPLCRAPIIPPDHQNHDQDHDHKVENSSSSLPSVEEATEDNPPAEVLRINVVSGEEGVENNLEDSVESNPKKDEENLGAIHKGSSSQRWSLERGAANLLSRSLSCSGKIFSSSNTRPSPSS